MNRKILIVDDHGHIRFMLTNRLTAFGYATHAIENAKNILKETLNFKPHLIIMDLMLPGIDGIEAIKILKNNNETKDIPIIMLTAVSSKKTVVEAVKAGAIDYIVKPFKAEDLHKKIDQILNKNA